MKLISAISESGIIGIPGDLPWNLPEDLVHFKKLTLNSTIVMGYNTFGTLGFKPLPKRKNVILSYDQIVSIHPDVIVAYSIQEIINNYNDSWIIGGASVYKQFLPYCDELHLTIVPDKLITKQSGPFIYFPWINPLQFKVKSAIPFETRPELTYVIMEKV
jgi:dihydrofolate reductase